MERLRWGVLSTAAIGVDAVIPAMQEGTRCDIVAIASREAERAAAVAGRLGIPRSYGSYEDLLADPEVDAVYNPLPNHMHAEWTIAAARAGKHVLCEKPLALNAAQAEEVVAACREAGVLLMEAFMYRLHPQWARVREIMDSGRLGELAAIQSFFSYRNLDPADIRNVPAFGGGGLLDIGCYSINASRMMFGAEPLLVRASIWRDPKFGTDALTSATLDFDGRHASFTCSTQIERDQWLRLVGTDARLDVEIPFNPPADKPARLVLVSGTHRPAEREIEFIEVPAVDQYTLQGDAFSAAVLDGVDLPTPPEDAIANMRAIDLVLASADS